MAAGAWTVFMIHAIEGSDWWQPVPKKTYIKTLDYLAKNKGTLWVAPMGEVAAYWKAQKIVENADIKFQNDAVEVSWNKPAPFPAGITLKIAVDTGDPVIIQNGNTITASTPGVYEISFDAGEMQIIKGGRKAR